MSDFGTTFCGFCVCLDTNHIFFIMCTIYIVCTDYFLVHAQSVSSSISVQGALGYLVTIPVHDIGNEDKLY